METTPIYRLKKYTGNDTADLTAMSPNLNTIESELAGTNYNLYLSEIDENGIYTVVEYKRSDDTLHMKSTLSNINANNNYLTDTWQFYDTDGVTVVKTVTWSLTYDADGNVISRVVS